MNELEKEINEYPERFELVDEGGSLSAWINPSGTIKVPDNAIPIIENGKYRHSIRRISDTVKLTTEDGEEIEISRKSLDALKKL